MSKEGQMNPILHLRQLLRSVLPPRPPFDGRGEPSRRANNPTPRIGAGTVRRLLAITFLVGLAGLGTLGASAGSETVQLDTSAIGTVQEIGTPGSPHFGGQVDRSELRRLLRPGPARPSPEADPDSPPRGEELWSAYRRAPAWELRPTRLAADSPKAVVSWMATTGSPPKRAVGGTPSDPQIAASSTHVVVGANDRMYFYTKGGTPYPSSANSLKLSTTDLSGGLFDWLIDPSAAGGPKLGLKQNGQIDNFNDSRVVFDPYRKRFWIVATGFCRTNYGVDENRDGKVQKCGFEILSLTERRSVIALAVSVDENPSHGWYIYWWDAAVGWGSGTPPYEPGDVADYPSLGVNATTVDVTVGISDKVDREYPHIALFRAADMAAGKPTVDGWHLYPLFNANGTCKATGLRNPDGTCPDSLVQPTLAHPDPSGSYLISRHPGAGDALVVWKVDDLLQPTQSVKSDTVTLPFSWQSPSPAKQKGGSATNRIDMSLGHAGVPIKSVWRWHALYLVSPDADSSGRATFRLLRLPTPGDVGAFDIPDPPNGGATQTLIGQGSTQSYGWPAIEANPAGDAVIVYTRVGPDQFAGIRYNAWKKIHPAFSSTLLFGRMLKQGEATIPASKTIRWGDLTGASVDFANGNEQDGIWIVHEYAWKPASGSASRALWVGKVFGKTYFDLYFPLERLAGAKRLLKPGDVGEFSARLANGGDERARATTLSLALTARGRPNRVFARIRVPGLRPGRTLVARFKVVIPTDLQAGRYRVEVRADAGRRAREYSLANNRAICVCSVVVERRE